MEFSIQILSAPPSMENKIHNFFYVFIMFIITKFGDNFEEKIDICFFLNV